MQKAKCVFSSFFLFALTIFEAIVPANAEDVKITTYYPSPYGAYKELSTTGDTNLATDTGTRLSVGTATPPVTSTAKLYVVGGPVEADAFRAYEQGGVFAFIKTC